MATEQVETRRPSAVFRDDSKNEADPHVACPECGCEYVHIISVEDSLKGKEGRGGNLLINFGCENDHKFSVSLQFHKGLTLIDIGK